MLGEYLYRGSGIRYVGLVKARCNLLNVVTVIPKDRIPVQSTSGKPTLSEIGKGSVTDLEGNDILPAQHGETIDHSFAVVAYDLSTL